MVVGFYGEDFLGGRRGGWVVVFWIFYEVV